jgi:hypothetical protein
MATTGTGTDTCRINPFSLADAATSTTCDGYAFSSVALTKWGVQIGGYGLPAGARIDGYNLDFPTVADGGVANYEIQGFVLRLLGCMMNIYIGAGIGARVRIGGTGAVSTGGGATFVKGGASAAAATVFLVERGTVLLTQVTSLNVIWDVANDNGRMTASRCEIQGGAFRRGSIGSAAVSQTVIGPTFLRLDRIRVFDTGATLAASLEGGSGDRGAALVLRRAGTAQIRCLVGSSSDGYAGVEIAEGSTLILQDHTTNPSTVVGASSRALVVDGDAVLPIINATTGVAGDGSSKSPVTTWAHLADAAYGNNVVALKTGSRVLNSA